MVLGPAKCGVGYSVVLEQCCLSVEFCYVEIVCACVCVWCGKEGLSHCVQCVSSLHCSIGFGTIVELIATPILFVLAFAVAVSLSIGIPITCDNRPYSIVA